MLQSPLLEINIKPKNPSKSSGTTQKEEFFYHQTENYKNYKYKLYNIDIKEIERKKIMGQKIKLADYNYPLDIMELKRSRDPNSQAYKPKLTDEKTEKLTKTQGILNNQLYYNKKKSQIMNKINKLSLELKITNLSHIQNKGKKPEDLKEAIIQNESQLPKIGKIKPEIKRQDSEDLLNGRLMFIINKKKKLDLPNINNSNQNEHYLDEEHKLFRRKIGGGFTLNVKKQNILRKLKSKSNLTIGEQESQLNLKTIKDQISQIIKSKRIKKRRSSSQLRFQPKISKTSFEEFILLSKETQEKSSIGFNILENFLIFSITIDKKEKFITLSGMKEYFSVFKNNTEEINQRIFIAFDINPFDSEAKINWEVFSKFKKILINKESSILERVNFLCKVAFFYS